MSQIVDNSIRALAQTGSQIQKLLVTLPAIIDAQLVEIQNNENTIADQKNLISANERSIETQVREAAAEIRLQVKEDSDSVLGNLLADRDLVAITAIEKAELEQRVKEAELAAQQTEFVAVKQAESKLHAAYKVELASRDSEYKVAVAEYAAGAKSDATTIALLKGQIASLEATIEANREAEIEKAKAAAQAQGVIVNAGK